MKTKKFKLSIDEEIQGSNEEFDTLEELVTKLNYVLDDCTIKVSIKKDAPLISARASNVDIKDAFSNM